MRKYIHAFTHRNGKPSGTKMLLLSSFVFVMFKFMQATTPEMVGAVASGGAMLLGVLSTLYLGRGATDAYNDVHKTGDK